MAHKAILDYLGEVEKAYEAGSATEHTYRPALKALLQALNPEVIATNEPRRIKCGAPDFIITRGETPLGYIEAKDVGEPLDKAEKSEQLQRYLPSLGNLILTDYLEFRWYVGGVHRQTVRAAVINQQGKLVKERDGIEQLEALFGYFLKEQTPTIGTPKDLAQRMASLARLIRDIITRALSDEDKGGELHNQMEGFRQTLLHELTADEFADMYAQTICYGMFAARVHNKQGAFTRFSAAKDLPQTNPFLRKLFGHIAGPDLDERVAWTVDDLAELLRRADINAILKDFGARTKQEDPVVHFYETFLAAYNPKLRETRGVYYTPEPVVQYIVQSVDEILKEDFGLKDGLADGEKMQTPQGECHKVMILDPATGTGTFLHAVVERIYGALTAQGMKGAWSNYVSERLLPRLFGFELLMAPYAVAHMKLGLQLAETGYDFKSGERLRVYLTNTLEEAFTTNQALPFADFISREANEAASVKKDKPVMVILGNPPYSGHSANTGEWIAKLLKGADTRTKPAAKTHNYFEVDGKPLGERNPKWLNDDYVKFIRFAQWRIEQTGYGILTFISNNGYLDNPTFRGMRQSLMQTFDDIYILNLHGNSKKKEKAPDGGKDENVFDIQQGVAIGIFVKKPKSTGECAVKRADLWGVRKEKYDALLGASTRKTKWKKLKPQTPFYLFEPQDKRLEREYNRAWKVTDIFPVNSVGIVTARDDLTIDLDKKVLWDRVKLFSRLYAEDARLKFQLGEDARDWTVELAQKDVKASGPKIEFIKKIQYRPFDERYVYYTGKTRGFICMPRPEIMRQMASNENIALSTTRSVEIGRGWEHVFCSKSMIQHHAVSLKEVNFLFPLYLYSNGLSSDMLERLVDVAQNGRRPNISEPFIKALSGRLGLQFVKDGRGDLRNTYGPEDVFNYIYGLFHSPAYRSRYGEFLKMDFPRVPIPASQKLFVELCARGGELAGLHLMDRQGPPIARFEIDGDGAVEKIRFEVEPGEAEGGKVWINNTQYFDGVPQPVWDFHIGGYQVCEKWLKDRKKAGRRLSFDDVAHYLNIVAALAETMRLMEEIDVEIEECGGWSDGFAAD